ncbi:MAG: hypothetical protein R6U98_26175 [Pirellulaceae bacterium]
MKGNSILRNTIHQNGGLGIDLGGDGVTANDAEDTDTGPNGLQNFPVLDSVVTSTEISGVLESVPNTEFRIEFFANETPDGSGYGEAEAFLYAAAVTTDNEGVGNFSVTLPEPAAEGRFLTATATDPAGSTSEFSEAALVLDVDEIVGIAIGDKVSGKIENPGERDAYVFDASAGQSIFFDLQSLTSDADGSQRLDFELLAPDGSRVFHESTITGAPDLADHGPVELETGGIYTLRVDGRGDDVASYRFQVRNVVDQTPPRVGGVWVRASGWDESFSAYLQSEGLGDENGYIIPLGSDDQLNTLPWSGIDTLTIAFSEEVNIAADQVHVYGVNTQEYSTDFAYNAAAQTATLTFDSPIDVDKLRLVIEDTVTDAAGNALDGEWEDGTSTESGDGTAGGDFLFRFDVLPGDATDSGNVVASDVSVLASAFGSFAGGSGDRYSVFVDYDGSGNVVAADVSILASHFGQFLPSGDPTVPVSQATSTTMSTASSSSVSESVSLPPVPTAAATTSDTVETTSPATTGRYDSDSDAAAESVSPETDEPVLGPVRPAPPVPGTPAALAVPVEVHDAVHVQPTAPETVAEVTEPWEQVSLDSRLELVERSAASLEESLFAEDESVETLGQSSGAVHASEDDNIAPGSCVSDVAISCALPIPSVSDADVRSLVVDRDERFAEAAVTDSLVGTAGVDELLSRVEPPVPGLYEPSGRSAPIDAMSRDLQSGRRSDTSVSAVSIDQMADGELSNNVEDEEDDIDRWSEAVDAVLALGTMF